MASESGSRLNRARALTLRGLRVRCRGSACPVAGAAGGCEKPLVEGNRLGCLAAEGDGPVPVGPAAADGASRVARDSWNPV